MNKEKSFQLRPENFQAGLGILENHPIHHIPHKFHTLKHIPPYADQRHQSKPEKVTQEQVQLVKLRCPLEYDILVVDLELTERFQSVEADLVLAFGVVLSSRNVFENTVIH